MARHTRAQAPEEDEPAMDISSLIDICFLLLIYFLVTTSIEKKEQDLDMVLPGPPGESSKLPKLPPLFIKVGESGAISVGRGASEEILDTDEADIRVPLLVQHIDTYATLARASGGVEDSKPVVQLYVESDAKQQRVVDVLNALAGAEITTVTFTDLIDAE